MRISLLFLFLFSTIIIASPQSNLSLGENYFKFGNYKKAIKILKVLPLKLDKDSEKVKAYKILGSSYYFEKKFIDAKKSFIHMLGVSSKATLDSLIYPPPLIGFFNRVNKEFKEKNKELENITNKDKNKQKIIYKEIKWKYVEEKRIIIEKNPFFTRFMPLGYAQYRNGDRSKAYILVTAESFLLATNVLSYWLLRSLEDKNGYYDAEIQKATVYKDIQTYSLIALIGVLIYGGVDGVVNYKPVFKKEIRVFKKEPVQFSFFGKDIISLNYNF